MTDPVVEPVPLTRDLRMRAAARLVGADASRESGTRAASALAVLHAMASSASTADDALALLHELQVHQVELDLQAEELQESRAELEADLRRRTALYEFQPVGCLTVDSRLVVREANEAGSRLLGVDAGGAIGARLDAFTGAATLDALRALMDQSTSGTPASRTLEWRCRHGVEVKVVARVAPDPAGHAFFVALMPVEPG